MEMVIIDMQVTVQIDIQIHVEGMSMRRMESIQLNIGYRYATRYADRCSGRYADR